MRNIAELVNELVSKDCKFREANEAVSDDFVKDYYLLSLTDPRMKDCSLAGLGLRFHEKWEIKECLKLGVSEEKLRRLGPYAHSELCDVAHGRANYEEHLLYQRVGETLLGKKIPIPALKLVSDSLTMQGILPTVFYDFGEHNEAVRAEEFSREDVEDAIELFEKTGWKFENKEGIFTYFAFIKYALNRAGKQSYSETI